MAVPVLATAITVETVDNEFAGHHFGFAAGHNCRALGGS